MDDIVQNIKDCGQSLIDNAEKIAGNLPKYVTDLSLTCYPVNRDDCVRINVDYDFVPEMYLESIKAGERN